MSLDERLVLSCLVLSSVVLLERAKLYTRSYRAIKALDRRTSSRFQPVLWKESSIPQV
jgi:hypothetical protein